MTDPGQLKSQSASLLVGSVKRDTDTVDLVWPSNVKPNTRQFKDLFDQIGRHMRAIDRHKVSCIRTHPSIMVAMKVRQEVSCAAKDWTIRKGIDDEAGAVDRLVSRNAGEQRRLEYKRVDGRNGGSEERRDGCLMSLARP